MNEELKDLYVRLLDMDYTVKETFRFQNTFIITLKSPSTVYEPTYVLLPKEPYIPIPFS